VSAGERPFMGSRLWDAWSFRRPGAEGFLHLERQGGRQVENPAEPASSTPVKAALRSPGSLRSVIPPGSVPCGSGSQLPAGHRADRGHVAPSRRGSPCCS